QPHPFTAEQDGQPPVAEPPPARGQLSQPGAQTAVIRSPAAIANRRAVHPHRSARPPLAHPIALAQVSHGLPSGGGRHHFFAAMSFNMTLSSIASARSFFSLAFSASSAFSRRASETSRPPYFAFHL